MLEPAEDKNAAIYDIVRDTMKNHSRIIFNGNNYSDEWVEEAEKRGLLNLKSAPDALPCFIAEKNVELFEKHNVLTKDEMYARYEIGVENYSKVINIEATTMVEMAKRDILPASVKYVQELSETVLAKRQVSANIVCDFEESRIEENSKLIDSMYKALGELESKLAQAHEMGEGQKQAEFYHDEVLAAMEELRKYADELEQCTAKEYWPFPTYGDLLFSIQ